MDLTAKKLLFVGEKRSPTAIRMRVSWRDGRLAAKPLFEALRQIGINPQDCLYYNVVDDILEADIPNETSICAVARWADAGYQVLALCRKVERYMRMA